MTVLLICMIPVAGLIGFLTGAMLRVASDAEQQAGHDLDQMKKDKKQEDNV